MTALFVAFGPVVTMSPAHAQQAPQAQAPSTSQPPAERYRVRLAGQTSDGTPYILSTQYEWSSSTDCSAAIAAPPVSDLVSKLKQSGAINTVNASCRKMPTRAASQGGGGR